MENSYPARRTDTGENNRSDKTDLGNKFSEINKIQKFRKRYVIEINYSFLNVNLS